MLCGASALVLFIVSAPVLAPAPAPAGMVTVPAGSFVRGSDTAMRPDERPAQTITLPLFFLDETLVTTAQFRRFVDDTGYVSTAEKQGFGMVAIEGMKDWEWQKARGATWRRPFFPFIDSPELVVADDWPVTMVSHDDADAYCAAQNKRLPTEAEWEYAMRAGATTRYPWGNDLRRPDGVYGLNHWQGSAKLDDDHRHNTLEDGFRYLSPVRAFPPNAFGLYDPVGNTWQLVSDWYADNAYARGPTTSPTGPTSGTKKVTRGGSWWCSARTCHGFGLTYRGKNKPDAAANNHGFRCAQDATTTTTTTTTTTPQPP